MDHEQESAVTEIPIRLKRGKNEILLKSANFDKLPDNRLWAFNLVVK